MGQLRQGNGNGNGNGKLSGRWDGIERPYGRSDVERLRGSVHIEHTLARLGAERLWKLLHEEPYVAALGALTGAQAVQMVKAGLDAIYLSGWQVAADANLAGETYPDQSLYPANSAPALVQRINSALLRADQIDSSGGPERHALARADRGRRGGRLRRAAERVRAHEVVHRGRRGRRALRGPALVGEEVRPPRRQGARADEPVHPHARVRAARRRRARRADDPRRAHGRALRDAPDERRGRARPRVPHGRADAGGLLPRAARDRGADRPRARVRAVRGPHLVRDVDSRSRRGGAVRRGDPREVSRASSSPTTARRRSTGRSTSTTRRSRRSSASSARWVTGSSS